jgi:hypothetical protein
MRTKHPKKRAFLSDYPIPAERADIREIRRLSRKEIGGRGEAVLEVGWSPDG